MITVKKHTAVAQNQKETKILKGDEKIPLDSGARTSNRSLVILAISCPILVSS